MLKPGRDARKKRPVIRKIKAIAFYRAIAFILLVIPKIGISVLKRKGAVFAVALLLVPFSALISVFGVQQPVTAQSASTLNFQGRLLNNTGGLVQDGIYNVEFNLYNVSSGGSSLWTEDRLVTNTQGVTVQNGYFSVYLGEYDNFGSLDWNQPLFLGMTIRGTSNCAWGSCTPADSEMTPRFKLTAVPYAFRAANVSSDDTSTASTDSDDVTVTSGDASGATSDSGNITIDTGTATGTTGSIAIGGTQASALTLGRAGLTTLNAGSLNQIPGLF